MLLPDHCATAKCGASFSNLIANKELAGFSRLQSLIFAASHLSKGDFEHHTNIQHHTPLFPRFTGL
jgi:hypothetical protein